MEGDDKDVFNEQFLERNSVTYEYEKFKAKEADSEENGIIGSPEV